MGVLLASRSFEIFAIRILILERGAIKGPGTPLPFPPAPARQTLELVFDDREYDTTARPAAR